MSYRVFSKFMAGTVTVTDKSLLPEVTACTRI